MCYNYLKIYFALLTVRGNVFRGNNTKKQISREATNNNITIIFFILTTYFTESKQLYTSNITLNIIYNMIDKICCNYLVIKNISFSCS